MSTVPISSNPESDVKPFGSSIQQFSQRMNNALSKFKLSDDLTDDNYITWARSMMQLFRSLEFHHFVLVENYSDENLTPEENEKVKFNLTVFLLNHMDPDNNTRMCNHLTDPTHPDDIIYNAFECWSELKIHHDRISEDKLEVVTKALYSCRIQKGDSLSSFVDKFENLIREFYRLKGELSDVQSARQLLSAIPTLPENVVDNIHDKVDPLTQKGVRQYLIKYEERHGWTSSAIREAHSVSASATTSVDTKRESVCTPSSCIGPHNERNFWAKPENAKKKKAFLARKRGTKTDSHSSSSAAASVQGVKKIERPSANHAEVSEAFSFHVSLHSFRSNTPTPVDNKENPTPLVSGIQTSVENSGLVFGLPAPDGDTSEEFLTALPSVFEDEKTPVASFSNSSTQILGLHDTGATHCMFKDKLLFDQSSLVLVDDKSKRVKLAGGDMSLPVHSRGVASLKSGDGTPFTIKNTLFVPTLSQNLIAGGLLKRQGVRELFDEVDSTSFSLVKGGVALFNGYIAENNLMLVQLEPVSHSCSTKASISQTEVDSSLLHLRLGHLSDRYLKLMIKNGCADGLDELIGDNKGCEVCHRSKGTKLPHNHTRPRAVNFLENVHVDVSGIIRTKSLDNEKYYILFCDDKSSYWHIFGLKNRSKEEVFEVFKFYIAMVERQTSCSLKQFTMDRGGEFLNDLLGAELRELGIILHLTAGHTPEQNGVSERGNRTIATRARSLMLQSGLPIKFWFLACSTAVFLTNRCYTRALPDGVTPFETWFYRKPSVRHLRVFGCQCFRLVRKEL